MLIKNGDQWLDTIPYVNDGGLWAPVQEGHVKNGDVYELFYEIPEIEWEDIVLTHVLTGSDTPPDPYDTLGIPQSEFDNHPYYEWQNIESVSLGILEPGEWGPWLTIDVDEEETGSDSPPTRSVDYPDDDSVNQYQNPQWVAAGSEEVYGTWSGWDVITLAEQQFSYQYSSTNSPVADIDVPANTNIAEYQNPEWVYSRQDVVTVTVMSTFIESESVFDIYLRPLYTETVLWSDLLSYPDPTLVSEQYDPAKKDYYHGVGPSVTSGHVSIGSYDGDTIDHRDFIDFETSPLWSITPNGQSSVALSTLSPEPAALTPPTSPNHNVTWIGWEETRVRTGIVNNVDYSDAVDVTLEDLTVYASLAESLGKATFDSAFLDPQSYPTINFNTLFDLGFSPNYFVWDSHELTPSKYGAGYQTVLLRGFKWGKGQRLRVWEPKFHYEELADVTYHYWNPTYEKRTRSMSTVYKWDGMVEKRERLGSWGPWLTIDVDEEETGSDSPPTRPVDYPDDDSENQYHNPQWVLDFTEEVVGEWSEWSRFYTGQESIGGRGTVTVPSNTNAVEYGSAGWAYLEERRTGWRDDGEEVVDSISGFYDTGPGSMPSVNPTVPPDTDTLRYRNTKWVINEDTRTVRWSEWSEWVTWTYANSDISVHSVGGPPSIDAEQHLLDHGWSPGPTDSREYRNFYWRGTATEDLWGVSAETRSRTIEGWYIDHDAVATRQVPQYSSIYHAYVDRRTRTVDTIHHWIGRVDRRTLLSDWGPWTSYDLRNVLGSAAETTHNSQYNPDELIVLPDDSDTEEYRNPTWVSNGSELVYGEWSQWFDYPTNVYIRVQAGETPPSPSLPSNSATMMYRDPVWELVGENIEVVLTTPRRHINVNNTEQHVIVYHDNEDDDVPFPDHLPQLKEDEYHPDGTVTRYSQPGWIKMAPQRVLDNPGWYTRFRDSYYWGVYKYEDEYLKKYQYSSRSSERIYHFYAQCDRRVKLTIDNNRLYRVQGQRRPKAVS